MSNINRRLLIPIGAGLMVLVLWYVALWSPQGSSLSKAKKRTEEAIAKRDNLRTQITRLQESQKDQPLKQAQLETMRVAIPDDPNLAQFILDANDAASKAGIDFLSITPTPPSQGGATTATTAAGGSAAAAAALTPIKIAMTISGGYFQVLNFINLLNALPRIVVVDGLSLSGSSPTQGTAGTTTGAAAAPVTASGGVQLSVSLQERIFTTSQQSVSGGTGGTAGTGTTATTTPGATTTTAAGGTAATTTPGATTATTVR
jgi:Tfp pilus assembly protein PilO